MPSVPLQLIQKRKGTSKHSPFPWRSSAPQITQQWLGNVAPTGDLSLCAGSVGLTRTFLGSSFPGVTGGFHQLDPGAATHCMSLRFTPWFLIAQVQAFRVRAAETERAIPQALHQLLPWADKNSTFVNWPKALP